MLYYIPTFPNHSQKFHMEKLATLWSNNDGEYQSKEFDIWCANHGVSREFFVPYSPQQNGVFECKNCTLLNWVRCLLHFSHLSKPYWGEANFCANCLLNFLPIKAIPLGYTLFEFWTGKKTNISYLHIFGYLAYAHVPPELCTNADDHSEEYIFLGITFSLKAIDFSAEVIVTLSSIVTFIFLNMLFHHLLFLLYPLLWLNLIHFFLHYQVSLLPLLFSLLIQQSILILPSFPVITPQYVNPSLVGPFF